jgi:hypothetical protein
VTTAYADVSARALAQITRKGGPVVFTVGTAPVYTPSTGEWTAGTLATVTLRAIQIEDDPERFSALGLVLTDPVTLLIAASGASITPAPGMPFAWAGVGYVCKNVEAVAPDGTPIIWTMIGSR